MAVPVSRDNPAAAADATSLADAEDGVALEDCLVDPLEDLQLGSPSGSSSFDEDESSSRPRANSWSSTVSSPSPRLSRRRSVDDMSIME
mgnify:CR=1 FL=1